MPPAALSAGDRIRWRSRIGTEHSGVVTAVYPTGCAEIDTGGGHAFLTPDVLAGAEQLPDAS